jgi:hypothetical protein
LRPPPALIAARSPGRERRGIDNLKCAPAVFATCPPRARHTGAALARRLPLFRFASVASRPRFSHDPVNLAPEYDG